LGSGTERSGGPREVHRNVFGNATCLRDIGCRIAQAADGDEHQIHRVTHGFEALGNGGFDIVDIESVKQHRFGAVSSTFLGAFRRAGKGVGIPSAEYHGSASVGNQAVDQCAGNVR
jgi:hypothetical protein